VIINNGVDKGKQGTIKYFQRGKNRVIVEGCRVRRRHDQEKAAYVVDEAWIHVSNVELIDPTTGKGTRSQIAFLEDGSQARIAVGSGALLPRPQRAEKAKHAQNETYDTAAADVLEATYKPPVYYHPPAADVAETPQ
jgi:large subunit ribosomal protein L24